jgi:hypothetical protein
MPSVAILTDPDSERLGAFAPLGFVKSSHSIPGQDAITLRRTRSQDSLALPYVGLGATIISCLC